MPKLTAFDEVVISMYAADHPPPHVHVYAGDDACMIDIETGSIIKGWVRPGALRKAVNWISPRRSELIARWSELQRRG